MNEKNWVRFGYYRAVPRAQKGTGSALDEVSRIVPVRHILGFVRTDWGEGNWTARDLR